MNGGDKEYELKDDDINLLSVLLSPEYVIPLAKEVGGGCAVSGAPEAYRRVREQVRGYIRFVRYRDEVSVRDLKIALSLRALGWVPHNYKHVIPFEAENWMAQSWRDTALRMWPSSHAANTPGQVRIQVGEATQKQINYATILAVGEMLMLHDDLNLAVLQGKVWQRRSWEVMVPMDVKGAVQVTVLDSTKDSFQSLDRKFRKGLRTILTNQKRPNKLIRNAPTIFNKWLDSGFITSPAGAIVSLVGESGVPSGYSALVDSNGVPIAITVGYVRKGEVVLSASIDHRALDGTQAGKIYSFLEARVPQILLQEKIKKGTK